MARAGVPRGLGGSTNATTILVKEVSNKVLPATIELWSAIAKWWVVVVRQPRLQLESRLVSMLDRVDSGALVPHFTPEDSVSTAAASHPLNGAMLGDA